jgi:signal transduction histidine kinase
VPDPEFERVFEPFFRRRGTLDNTGAGLGLALVRQIARRHGGEARCALMKDGRSCFECAAVELTSSPRKRDP